MIPFIGDIIGNVIGIAGDWLKDKRRLKQSKVDAEINRVQAKTNHVIKMAEAGQMADIDWDVQAMKNAQNSWMDDFWTVVLALPLILMFIPAMAPVMVEGFAALDSAPDYYKAAVGVSIAAAFGFRKLANKFIK